MRRSVPFVFFAIAACGGESHANGTPATSTPSPTPTTANTEGTGNSEAESGRPDGIRVRAEAYANGDVVAIVEAHGAERVRLRGRLIVEKLVNDDWTGVDGAGLDLRADCATPAPECVDLVRGGGLRPPRWNARARGGQCDAAGADASLPSGRYRFVATTCDGVHRVEGVPFEITR